MGQIHENMKAENAEITESGSGLIWLSWSRTTLLPSLRVSVVGNQGLATGSSFRRQLPIHVIYSRSQTLEGKKCIDTFMDVGSI